MSDPWETRTLTQDELAAEAARRFGPDPKEWAFVCPNCGDVARSRDFDPYAESGHGSDLVGQMCIGRKLGALHAKSNEEWTKSGGRGCDWAAFGLFHGPWKVEMPDGTTVSAFALA